MRARWLVIWLAVSVGLNVCLLALWLRALKPDDRPLLFKINLDAGHGGASGRYDHLREIAFDYAFILTILGRAG